MVFVAIQRIIEKIDLKMVYVNNGKKTTKVFVCHFAEDLVKMQYPHFFSREPPDIYHWLYRYLCKEECSAFPSIPSVTPRLEHVIMVQTPLL